MISHVIYHIPGRKVGCTRDIKLRKGWYKVKEGAVPDIIIVEELHDATDQEAGDREWHWADHFGYKRGIHYTRTIAVTMSDEERFALAQRRGKKAAEVVTAEERSERARHATAGLTPDQRAENSRKGGLKGGRRTVELGKAYLSHISPEERVRYAALGTKRAVELKRTGAFMRDVCVHCGHEGNLLVLGRFHNDRCAARPRRRRDA